MFKLNFCFLISANRLFLIVNLNCQFLTGKIFDANSYFIDIYFQNGVSEVDSEGVGIPILRDKG